LEIAVSELKSSFILYGYMFQFCS